MTTTDSLPTVAVDLTGEDYRFARAAIDYGRRALGRTAPNPSVGALVVSDGVIAGRGLTRQGGRPHAETEALADAGEAARGATMYVSLEPCSHVGVTPPCAQAIIDAGIARVVSSLDDPDPRVSGRGHQMLRDAGIEVVSGVAADEAYQANLGHIMRVTEGRPMVTLKMAETKDGYAAGDVHDGRLKITGQAANNRVQMMRSTHDAIMVGAATARIDNPLLTIRMPGMEARKRLRVVIDGSLSLPMNSRLVSTCESVPLLVVCGENAPADKAQLLRDAGVEVVELPGEHDGRLDLAGLLAMLGSRGITRVFSEGGPKVGSELVRRSLADQVIIFTSPKPLGRVGEASLNADARAFLEQDTRYRLEEDGFAGQDRMRVWWRQT